MSVDLRALAREAALEHHVVGAQIAVLHRGVLSTAEAGVARFDTGVPVTDDTLFQIGSTTKLHSAILVMQLVSEGRVGLDVPVSEQLPGFRLATDEVTEAVTPRQLLSMSSGMDNGSYDSFGSGDDALARYVAALRHIPHQFMPGTGYGYSNASTNVCGRLVEHVTGQSWEHALRERLLEPAGLAESSPWADEVIVRRHALGHVIKDDEPELLPYLSLTRSMGPAGGTLCSTARDLVRLAHVFLYAGTAVSGNRVLDGEQVLLMQTRQVTVPTTLLADFWGLGPFGVQWEGGTLVGHSGTNLSGSSYLLWAPEHDLAVATVVNTPSQGYPFAHAVFAEVFRALAGLRPPARPEPPEHVDVPVERLIGSYAMASAQYAVTQADHGLSIKIDGYLGQSKAPSALVPLDAVTFLPTDPVIDGNRGWALTFLSAEGGRATHLLNGFFCARRVA